MTTIHRPARLATRAASFRYGGRHHSGIPGGIIPLHPGGFVGIGSDDFAIALVAHFDSRKYRLKSALTDAATELHPGWRDNHDGSFTKLDPSAPEQLELTEWLYKLIRLALAPSSRAWPNDPATSELMEETTMGESRRRRAPGAAGRLPDFIFVRDRAVEEAGGFTLAGRVVTDIPRYSVPSGIDQRQR